MFRKLKMVSELREVTSDIVMKTKDSGRSSLIQCPMLTSKNYTVWAMRMKVSLKVHKV